MARRRLSSGLVSLPGRVSAVDQPLYQQHLPQEADMRAVLPTRAFSEFKAQVRLVLTFWISWLTGRTAPFYTL